MCNQIAVVKLSALLTFNVLVGCCEILRSATKAIVTIQIERIKCVYVCVLEGGMNRRCRNVINI